MSIEESLGCFFLDSTNSCPLSLAWCGTGCQIGFGACNAGSCASGPASSTASATSTSTSATATATTVTDATSTSSTTSISSTTSASRTTITTITYAPGSVPRFVKQTEVGSYFAQWGVYSRSFKMKHVAAMPSSSQLTFINYAFGNIYQKNGGYECGIVNKLESGQGDGGDAWADFGMGYSTADSVDGVADTWDQPLAGSFNQLRKLKQRLPKLRAFISLGGWTWSKWFSKAAETDALRKQLVSSCIDVYLRGNLPIVDGRGGNGSAAGVFDGIDIDWLVLHTAPKLVCFKC